MMDVVLDGSPEFTDVAKTASANPLVRQVPKPPFHHIEPRTCGGDEVQLEARMPIHPVLHPRMFMGPIVVHNEMQIEMGRGLGVNLLEEPDELLMSMPRQTIADDVPIKQVQRRKQGRRAVASIIMRHRAGTALLHRQAGLRAIQGLDLAFLIHGEHQRFVWRIQIQPHHVVELLDKLGITAELERLAQMRLEPVLLPYPAYRRFADPLCVRHGSGTPVRRRERGGVQRRLDNGADLPGGNARKTTRAGCIVRESSYAQPQKPLTPQLDRGPRDPQLLRNVLIQDPLCSQRDDLGALHDPQGQALRTSPCGQRRALRGGQDNR